MNLKTLAPKIAILTTLCAASAQARHPFVGATDASSEPFAALRQASQALSPTYTSGGADVANRVDAPASRGPRFHANARVGVTYNSIPVVVDRGLGGVPDRRVEGAGGPGVAATLEVWPIFAEHAGLGAYASGTAAATMGEAESAGNTGYDLGGTAFIGPDRIASVVGRYSRGYRQAAVIDGYGLGGFGGNQQGAGQVSLDTDRWGVGLRGCPARNENDTRCAVQVEYVYVREGVAGADERATVHSLRVDWRGYFGISAEYAPAWFIAENADSQLAPNDLAKYFAFNIEYRNDFFGGAW